MIETRTEPVDLSSGGRGRRFESSHSDQFFKYLRHLTAADFMVFLARARKPLLVKRVVAATGRPCGYWEWPDRSLKR